MYEEWVTLLEFPMYQVNNLGHIKNKKVDRFVATSLTRQNVVKVALVNERGRFTRSVAVLVAHIFVHGYNDIFNTPIHLDGDLTNCEATNLLWRPRWFAYQYHRQFTHNQEVMGLIGQAGPIIESATSMAYYNIFEVATTNGLLMQEINYKAGLQAVDELEKKVWPTGQIFEFGNRKTHPLYKSEY
jgi:hypothetical protein